MHVVKTDRSFGFTYIFLLLTYHQYQSLTTLFQLVQTFYYSWLYFLSKQVNQESRIKNHLTIKCDMIFYDLDNFSCIFRCIVYIQKTSEIVYVPDNSIIHSSLPRLSNCFVQNIVFWKLFFMILFPRYLCFEFES